MSSKMRSMFLSLIFASGVLLFFPYLASAAVEITPPVSILYFNTTVGPATIIPLVDFSLRQTSGTDTVSKVGFYINASTTISNGEISRVSLWRDSGANAGFQISEDVFITGAASTTPDLATDAGGSTLIILTPTTAITPASNYQTFYIIASTTGTIANITNGHAFDVSMDANFASTTAGSGLGNAYAPSNKITLERTLPVKISEVYSGTATNIHDEFIELYNTTEYPIDLQQAGLRLHIYDANGSSSPKTLTYNFGRNIIPGFGYFLIGSATNYSGSTALDATYNTLSGNTLTTNTGLSIATSSVTTQATSTKIDMIGWGMQPVANAENSATLTIATSTDIADNSLALERIARGYPDATSTAATLASGGADEYRGNGIDRNDNSVEFVVQTSSRPQNTQSAREFPFGGGYQDNAKPRIMSSYPANSATGIPSNLSFIGAMFDEPVNANTVNSTSITLTQVGGGGSTLCSSVTYNPNPGPYDPQLKCMISALSASSQYTFTASTSIQDLQGNYLDQNSSTASLDPYTATFTVGGSSQTTTNITPPYVIGTTPFAGSANIPTNITKFTVKFSQNMNSSTLSASTISLYSVSSGTRTAVSGWSSASFSWDATSTTLTISSLPTLTANTQYELDIDGMDSATDTTGVKSINNIILSSPQFVSAFTTGSGADASAPSVLGSMPVRSGDANVSLNQINFIVSFDDHLDASTATSGSVTLGIVSGANLPGSVSYNSFNKELSFTANNALPAGQNLILTLVGASIKNISNVLLGGNYTMSFSTEAASSDTTAPTIMFINADEFGIAVTFDEAVNSDDAKLLNKYTVTQNSAAVTLDSMAGQTITYDASNRTAKISGVRLTSGATLEVTVANIRDISGNNRTSSTVSAPVKSTAQSGGMIDPGMSSNMGTVGPPPGASFTMGGGGSSFMPGAKVMTMNNFASATSTYGFELPISQQIDANGQIVITFPQNSDYFLTLAATSSSNMVMLNENNKDINGPGLGTIGIKTITNNNSAKTITLTLDTATRSEFSDTHDFLKFGITDIANPSIPKGPDSTGYLLDIKTKNSSGVILESGFSLNPVFIGGGNFGGMATTTIRGQILGSNGNYGLNGVRVMLSSPILGPMPRMETSTSSVWGSAHGEFRFTNLPVNNDYFLFMEPDITPVHANGVATTTTYFGATDPAPMRATSTSVITQNLTLTPTTAAVSLPIKMIVSANTFTATEKIDVFAGSQGKFIAKTVTPGAGANDGSSAITTLKIPQNNGMWFVGIGPAMPKDGVMMGPPPSTTWINPKPIELNMSGCTGSCSLTSEGTPVTSHTFNISRANKSIAGIVRDASGNALGSAMVYGYSTTQMMGNQTQSNSAGIFSLPVTEGSYNVGAFYQGMGQSSEVSVEVIGSNIYVSGSKTASTGSSGTNPFIITIKKPAYTITGRVTDGTNVVSNAPVFAYRTDGPGHADSATDTSGNYTLYVDNGSWRVNAQVSGYGQMTEQSVTVAGANQSNINFSPSSSTTYWSIVGTVFESGDFTIDSGEGLASAMVVAKRGASIYETKTGTDGTYTLRVPQQASGYTLEVSKPGYGRIPSLNEYLSATSTIFSNFGVTGTTTKNVRMNTRRTVTINIKDSSGNFVMVPSAFIDFYDMNINFGNHVEIRNGTSTTVQIPTGYGDFSSTTIRAFIPSIPQNNISVASDDVNSSVISGVLRVDGTEVIKVVISANLRTITGNIYHTASSTGNELRDAWVEVIDATNGMHYGVSATSTTGDYSIKLADGTYKILAVKPGYIMTPQSLTVSANVYQSLVMNSASLTLSGSVTAGGVAAPNAFVKAEKIGGGFAVTQTDASGNFSGENALKVNAGTWRIFAASQKYSETAYSGNPLTVTSSQTGITIALTTAASVQDTLATSQTFKDTSSGSMEDTTVNVKVTVDSGALGQAGSDSYMTAQETANYPDTPSVNVIGSKAKEINAYSGGSQVKNLETGKKAEVELTYTIAELSGSGIDTPAEVSKLKVSAWSDTNKEWEALNTVATYKNSSGNAVDVATSTATIPGTVTQITFKTTEATHFSAYALTEATEGAPDTPSGLTATAGAAGTFQVSLSWGSVSGATGYYLYRDTASDGSFPLLTSTANTSYTNTGLSATTYYYKVAASKSSGASESAASAPVSATVTAIGGGGVISGGGGGGGGYTAPSVPVQTSSKPATVVSAVTTVPAATVAVLSPVAVSVSPVFTKTFKLGMASSDVKRLQQLLNSDPDTKISSTGVGSSGNETEYFGNLTVQAIQKFQKKYGIASSGTPETTGYGALGPKTRAKLAEVFAKATPTAPSVAPASPAGGQPSSVALSVSPVFNAGLKLGMMGADIKRLQQLLNSDPDTKIAETGVGSPGNETEYFGNLTIKALQKFQAKHGIVSSGTPETTGYGALGPKTRTKIKEVFKSQ